MAPTSYLSYRRALERAPPLLVGLEAEQGKPAGDVADLNRVHQVRHALLPERRLEEFGSDKSGPGYRLAIALVDDRSQERELRHVAGGFVGLAGGPTAHGPLEARVASPGTLW